MTVLVLAVVLAACSLLQAERVVVRSFAYWMVIECRGDVVPSADSCRQWGERVLATSSGPAPESTEKLMLINEGSQCKGIFLDQNGNPLESFGVACP
jgi:hypothetical protein